MLYFPITIVTSIYILVSSIVTAVLNLVVYIFLSQKKKKKKQTTLNIIISIGAVVKLTLFWLGFFF